MKRRAIAAILTLLASGTIAQTSITPSGGSGGAVTISGSTATSGCVAGGVLRSISNLVDCGAGLTYTSAAGLRAGDSSLGSTTVPLTARLGTGSTANVFEMQNSAGTILSSFSAIGQIGVGALAPSYPIHTSLGGGLSSPILWMRDTASGVHSGFGNASGSLLFFTNGSTSPAALFQGGTYFGLTSNTPLAMCSTTNMATATCDTILARAAAATFQMGSTITSGSAINQTIRSHNATTGTNIDGGNFTIDVPGGTGSSTGGTFAIKTAPVLGSGTTAQTSVDRLTIAKNGNTTVTTVGTQTEQITARATGVDNRVGLWVYDTDYSNLNMGVHWNGSSYIADSAGVFFQQKDATTISWWGGTGNTPGGAASYAELMNWDLATGNLNVGGTVAGTSKLQVSGVTGTTVAATINNGTSTGNILNLQDNGSNVFTVADGGAVTASGSVALNAGGALAGDHFAITQNLLGLRFVSVGNSGSYISTFTANTPDVAALRAGDVANAWHLFESADAGDFGNGPCGTSACTDPAFIVHSAAQDTTQYNALAVWGSAGGAVKALTESAATSTIRIPVANNSRASGILEYEIYATDGTDMQVRTASIRYAMTNKAGTEACSLTTMGGVAVTNETDDGNAASLSAGTLTYAIACTNNAADTMDITFNAVSSLTQTTLQATYSLKHLSPGQPLRQ